MDEIASDAQQSLAGIWYAKCQTLQARLTRLQAACLGVLDWADAQDEERRPEWVDRLERVMEEQA
jgi:hypothetical protein